MSRSGYTLFETPLGACGIAWEGDRVKCIQLPEADDTRTIARLRAQAGEMGKAPPPAWVNALAIAISRHMKGESQDFEKVPLALDGFPPFRRKVYETARKIGPSRTATYGELAKLAGKPGGARAVGQALAKNPFPIVVPCHRILAAGGKPGGFSAFGKLDTKAKLLAAEGAPVACIFDGKGELPFDWELAKKVVGEAEAALARVISRARPVRLTLEEMHSPFESLLEAIVYQQLSGKAAATIAGRVKTLLGEVTPERLLAVSEEQLRGCGLSRAKTAAVRDLAAKTIDGTVPTLARLRAMPEEEIVERLTAVRGVGRWTVEMLLIFRLGRPDVLPATDHGVRKGFQKAFRKRALPTPKELLARGERWRPFRTVASWYLWRATEL